MIHIYSYFIGVVLSAAAYGSLCMFDEQHEEYANTAAVGIVLWPIAVVAMAAFWVGCWLTAQYINFKDGDND